MQVRKIHLDEGVSGSWYQEEDIGSSWYAVCSASLICPVSKDVRPKT